MNYSSDERAAILGWLEDGCTANEIAARFSRAFRPATRNGIIGLVHRDRVLGAVGFARKARSAPAAKAEPREKPAKRRAARVADGRRAQEAARGKPERNGESRNPKLLADLGWRECRWPVNDAAPGEPHLFCAAGTGGEGPYCPHHRARAGAGYGERGLLSGRAA